MNKVHDRQIKLLESVKENGCVHFNGKHICKKKIIAESKYFCEAHKKKKIKWHTSKYLNLSNIRRDVITSNKNLTPKESWQKEVPYDTRQLSLKSLIGNIKSAITNKKNKNIENFEMHFKSKKSPSHVFYVNKKAIKNFNIFKTKLNDSKLRVKKDSEGYYNYEIKSDCIMYMKNNMWYLIIPKKRTVKYENAKISEFVALDPGVRTFQTFYSPDKVCGKIGDELPKKLMPKLRNIDLLKSLRTKIKVSRTRRNMKIRCSKLKTKVQNIINDLHWKTCSYLTDNFQTIILPKFGVKGMVRKSKTRKINNTTVRAMLALRHYEFQMRLKEMCASKQRNLLIVDEHYTSKTCGKCGTLKDNLGGNKVYNCQKCHVSIDRDINGARNIYLKTVTQSRV